MKRVTLIVSLVVPPMVSLIVTLVVPFVDCRDRKTVIKNLPDRPYDDHANYEASKDVVAISQCRPHNDHTMI